MVLTHSCASRPLPIDAFTKDVKAKTDCFPPLAATAKKMPFLLNLQQITAQLPHLLICFCQVLSQIMSENKVDF